MLQTPLNMLKERDIVIKKTYYKTASKNYVYHSGRYGVVGRICMLSVKQNDKRLKKISLFV